MIINKHLITWINIFIYPNSHAGLPCAGRDSESRFKHHGHPPLLLLQVSLLFLYKHADFEDSRHLLLKRHNWSIYTRACTRNNSFIILKELFKNDQHTEKSVYDTFEAILSDFLTFVIRTVRRRFSESLSCGISEINTALTCFCVETVCSPIKSLKVILSPRLYIRFISFPFHYYLT